MHRILLLLSLTIYEMPHSPYCIPIKRALDAFAIPHERVPVPNWDRGKIMALTDGAYYQVPVDEASIPFIAVVTPFGSWEFLKLPFGVTNAVPTFQRLIDCVMSGLPFVFCYLDDLLIFRRSVDDHQEHLKAVFT